MGKTLILSDIHFCKKPSKVTSAKQLRTLWDSCDRLVLNGDTTEAHSSRYSCESKERAAELIELANSDGVSTTLICGNHDPISSEHDYIWCWDKTVLVFHGHAAFPKIAPWSWRSPLVYKARMKYLKETGDGFHEQLLAVRRASHDSASGVFSSNRPSLPKMLLLACPAAIRVFYGWQRFPSLVSSWANQYAPTSRFIITGHTHHAGIWKRDERVIINTGCFGFPSHPRAVIIDEDTLSIFRLKLSRGNYSFGRVFASWNAR